MGYGYSGSLLGSWVQMDLVDVSVVSRLYCHQKLFRGFYQGLFVILGQIGEKTILLKLSPNIVLRLVKGLGQSAARAWTL